MGLFEQLGDSIAHSAPRILLALVILLTGWLIARLLSKAVFVVLARTPLAAWASRRLGIPSGRYGHRVERVIARAVFYAMMVVVIVLALDALDLGVITRPMQAALTELAEQLPNLLGGVVVLIAGIAAARIVGGIAEGLLRELGFDRFFLRHIPLGSAAAEAQAAAEAAELAADPDAPGAAGAPGSDESLAETARRSARGVSMEPSRVPSRVVGQLVTVLVVLLVVLQVLSIMHLDSMARLLERFMSDFLPNLGVAALILLAGLWAGAWVKRHVDALYSPASAAPGGVVRLRRLPRMAGSVARAAVLVFAFAMALQQVGVAPELIAIAFAILFGSLCLALALAFGLGGREVAAEIVREEYERRSIEAAIEVDAAEAAAEAAAKSRPARRKSTAKSGSSRRSSSKPTKGGGGDAGDDSSEGS